MATLVLTSVVGAMGLTGLPALAATVAATAVGTFIDSALFGGQQASTEGTRLSELNVTTSSEGSVITRLWGRSRLGGNVIWAANFLERGGSDGLGGSSGLFGSGKGFGSQETTTEYTYSVSFAVAFCEGNSRTRLGRVWADGNLLDTEDLDVTFYPGSETQTRDPTIEGIEGTNRTSAYRGTAYLVFKDLPLADFGNRIPQITAEIIKPIASPDSDSADALIEGVCMIPSTGEAVYATTPIVRDDGFGNAAGENVTLSRSKTNMEASMEDLDVLLPNCGAVNLVTAWFGTDLRASHCEFAPRVESKTGRTLLPTSWSVDGLDRSSSYVEETSRDGDGNPAFGGTPADFAVVEAVQRIADVDGKDVYFYPFVLMDIPSGNTLPNTDDGTPGQPVYPWRGRITTSLPSVDKTSAAQTEVDSLFGTVSASDFSVSGTAVTYTGTATDFGYRRMVLHYAHLCAAAAQTLADSSKFKGFFIGSELVGVTRIRSTASSTATASTVYPGVNALVTLLEDVRALFDSYGLTSVKLSYAADWSEYHSHRPSDSSNDVYFNMDAIWGHADCDFVSIDNYMKLSDWRDGTAHEDYGTGTVTAYATTGTFGSSGFPQSTSVYDKDYLQGQVEGGEDYDYYYASDADRDDQVRTTIEDTGYSEHWVFRQKDIRNWWGQSHRSRPGGTRDSAVTALSDGASGSVDTWTASDKKVVFSEYGCPAVDRGTNQPNVFYDPKSSESALPYYSSGLRDDFMQRTYYEALVTYWRDNSPTSPITMLDPTDMFAWTWDARPYPVFPYRTDIWSDGPNYRLGHWLNGRMGSFTLGELVREICALGGLTDADIDVSTLTGNSALVRGYVVDQQSSPRDMLSPLTAAYLFDGFESEGVVKFAMRLNTAFTTVTEDELVVDSGDVSGFSLTRTQETELPGAVSVSFVDESKDYQVGSAGGVRLVGSSLDVIDWRFPIVLTEEYAKSLSEIMIQQDWVGRERGELRLPPSYLALDPADGVSITLGNREVRHVVGRIERGGDLELTTAGFDPSVFDTLTFDASGDSATAAVAIYGQSKLAIMDLPLVTGDEARPWAPRLAVYQSPFPSSVDVYRDDGTGGLTLNVRVRTASMLGETTAALGSADPWRFDRAGVLSVKLYDPSAALLSATESEVLNGANAAAVETSSGTWEVLQFVDATLTGTSDEGLPLYDLTTLLRGQLGTETEIESSLASGARFVILDEETVDYLRLPSGQKTFTLDYRYGPHGVSTDSNLFQDVTHTGQATGLLPYAPVHLKKTPTAGSYEVTFTWVRRTRFGGDDFETEDVPLNEEEELYDLKIYDPSGPTLLRTVSDLTSPSYTYTEAYQTSDGGHLDSYLIYVWQKSASVGKGRRASATL